MGPTDLLPPPPPKEVVLQVFITLNHRPRPGLNPRTLGPVASTLTTSPPRAAQRHLVEAYLMMISIVTHYRNAGQLAKLITYDVEGSCSEVI
jgi:hypothetical protein